MPARCGLAVEDGAEVAVLLADVGGVGDAVEEDGVGLSAGGGDVAEGEAEIGCVVWLVAGVFGEGGVVEGAGGDAVAGVLAGEVGEEVELADGSAEGCFLAIGSEVSAFGGVLELGQGRGAATCGERDYSGEGVGAVEGAVRFAENLGARDAGGGDVGELDGSADVVGRDAVDEDLVGVGVASADVEAGGSAGLAGLGDLDTGDVAERFLDILVVGEVFPGEDGDRGVYLGKGGGGSGGGDGDFFGGRGGREGDVEVAWCTESGMVTSLVTKERPVERRL